MVREARFAWDNPYSLPEELTQRNWDSDDPDHDPERRRAPAAGRRRTPSAARTDRKSRPQR